MGLTGKENLFCKEYILDFNGTDAIIRAKYTKNRQSASVLAYRMLRKVKIQSEIARLLAAREEKYDIKEEQIIAELVKLAMYDIGNYVQVKKVGKDVRVVLNPTKDLDMTCIQEVRESTGKTNTLQIKGYDKGKALELLMRYKGMLNDKLSLGGVDEFINGLRKSTIPPKPEKDEEPKATAETYKEGDK